MSIETDSMLWRVFSTLWMAVTFLAFAFFNGAMFYAAWFRYDLIIKWAHEDKWAGREHIHTALSKWFLRLMMLLWHGILLVAIVVMIKGGD